MTAPPDPWVWLKWAKKDFLITTLVERRWSSRTAAELQKYEVAQLRTKLQDALQRYGRSEDRRRLADHVLRERRQVEERRRNRQETQRQRKEQLLALGQRHFVVGAVAWVFDERVAEKYNRTLRIFDPLQAKVVTQSDDGKTVEVEFQQTRRWMEAGGHWVYKGQRLRFHFEPRTCMWLREGLTSEVVRSYGQGSQPRYFELSHTRQYLVLPRSTGERPVGSETRELTRELTRDSSGGGGGGGEGGKSSGGI